MNWDRAQGDGKTSRLLDFLNMMQATDAFFPIGAFTLSNGVETYVQQEKITDCETLRVYIDEYMRVFPCNDLGLMYFSYLNAEDENALVLLDQLSSAMKSPSEIRVGSNKMCLRFLKAEEKMTAGKRNARLANYFELIKTGQADGYHPIALGIFAFEQRIDIDEALGMYGYSVLSAIVNNAVKLVPLGQIDGQRVLNNNLEKIEDAVARVKKIDMDMLGVSGCSYEIRCMQHEVLYSRLYMS